MVSFLILSPSDRCTKYDPQYTHSFCDTKKNETMLPAHSIPILQEGPSNYCKLQVCLRVLLFEALLCQYLHNRAISIYKKVPETRTKDILYFI